MHQFLNDFLCKLEAVVKCGHGAQRAKSKEVTALPPPRVKEGELFTARTHLHYFHGLDPTK